MAEPQTPTTLVDWLDDLSVRFLLNLPQSELSSVPRLCFQVEEAQWFYEDFVRPAVAASGAQPLPSLHLRQFCLMLFQHCPLLSGYEDAQHIAAYEEFLAYKVRVPVRGAILLDEKMEKVVLVRGWKKGSSWSFPRGKINKDEKDLDCAIREVYEETGYHVRQAGLVPDEEKDAKYVDITMREQHMRLFIFRGVPEDTHFEPRTRKEISKIQWYPIRDLPGFKKQKHGQTGDGGNANKFYMVAPFLGPLKKWISWRRKMDASQPRHTRGASDGLGIQTATEDEGETEDAAPEPLVDHRGEELKRLLSIGGGFAAPAQQSVHNENQTNDLLAMLRGSTQPTNGSRTPQTPFDQLITMPKEPETSQFDHVQRPPVPLQQRPPQYPLSSPQALHEQRNHPLPTPQIFGPGSQLGGFPTNLQHGFPGMVPPHLQQQQHFQQHNFQQRPSVPNRPLGQPINVPYHAPPEQQMQPLPMLQAQPQTQTQTPYQQHVPNAYGLQGPQGAIASGPSAPNASQLPAPRLNTHHMNLLNAFKSSGKPVGPAAPVSQPTSRHGSTHQTALLDLFRKPSATQEAPVVTPVQAASQAQMVSPTLTEATEKPKAPKQERGPTLNEITRTLPMKAKTKSPPPPATTAAPLARPSSGHLFDHTAQKAGPATSSERAQQQAHPISVLQRPVAGQARPATPAKASGPAVPNAHTRSKQNGASPAPFTILARPGSRGLKSPGPVAPPSPLRNQTPQNSSPFQPQVLKRPRSGEGRAMAAGSEEQGPRTSNEDGQKGHLLALFGKGSTSTASSDASLPNQSTEAAAAPAAPTQPQINGQKNALLELLKSPTSGQATPTPAPVVAAPPPLPPPPPPAAPRLSPSRNPSSQSQQKIHPVRQPVQPPTNHHQPTRSNQQNLLVDIFNRPSSSTSHRNRSNTPPVHSPGTPISPFTLGTPAQMQAPERARQQRLGSMVSVASNGSVGFGVGVPASPSGAGTERKGSTGTPVEAKEFLMGFLNGVAKSGGQRSG